MADPISAGLILTGVAATTVGKVQSDQAAAAASGYNATVLRQQATEASNVGAANEAMVTRRSAGQLGEQAAAIGEANVGTQPQVEKQSATNARMDALNVWYGGELERHQALDAASLQRYQQLLSKYNETGDVIGGALTGATKIAMGAANYQKGGTFSGGMSGGDVNLGG